MAFLKASDTISGQEGRAYATINGQTEEMFYVKTLEATVEKQKAEVKPRSPRRTAQSNRLVRFGFHDNLLYHFPFPRADAPVHAEWCGHVLRH